MTRIAIMLAGAASVLAGPALAQSRPSVGAEITTDEVRRGLSWSDGRPALSADVATDVAGFDLSGRVVTTRASRRHAGADAVADLEVGRGFDLGGLSLRASVTGHLFAGSAIKADYYELGGTGSYTLGPVTLDAGAKYAPDQSAIGGDNLYLFANASGAIIGTPLTANAGIGRSSGSTDDPVRAARLRPAGNYTDWRLGLSYGLGKVTLSVDYIATNIDDRPMPSPLADPDHVGDRFVARARIAF
ncbi:TorF family putative porin [uncultured Sphingomonas sp.]|uniref:TorF family putative porin n=1 Tax=uncultured Sphingomonas sp. TaxID=158754 RepID=UPI0025D0CC66|nr:TorF family putative porin [uncultured Sphingomonas sp.]